MSFGYIVFRDSIREGQAEKTKEGQDKSKFKVRGYLGDLAGPKRSCITKATKATKTDATKTQPTKSYTTKVSNKGRNSLQGTVQEQLRNRSYSICIYRLSRTQIAINQESTNPGYPVLIAIAVRITGVIPTEANESKPQGEDLEVADLSDSRIYCIEVEGLINQIYFNVGVCFKIAHFRVPEQRCTDLY